LGSVLAARCHGQVAVEPRPNSRIHRAGPVPTAAYANRIASIAQLATSAAHEINAPLSGIIANASMCLQMLDAQSPNVDGARETAPYKS
jgi:signal transduction histidine kinase